MCPGVGTVETGVEVDVSVMKFSLYYSQIYTICPFPRLAECVKYSMKLWITRNTSLRGPSNFALILSEIFLQISFRQTRFETHATSSGTHFGISPSCTTAMLLQQIYSPGHYALLRRV